MSAKDIKTKTILITATVPENCKVNNLECYTPEKGFFHPKIEIKEPPTQDQIDDVSYSCQDFDGARRCMNWVLNYLGL